MRHEGVSGDDGSDSEATASQPQATSQLKPKLAAGLTMLTRKMFDNSGVEP